MEEINIAKESVSSEAPEFYTTAQIAHMMGCSVPVARQLFHRADFPAIKCGKNFKIEKHAFIKWCGERRL